MMADIVKPVAGSSRQTAWRFIKFTFFSLSAGLIQAAAFSLLKELAGLSYWPSYLIALLASVVWNLTFNRRYTFRSTVNISRAMVLVLAYYAVFTPLSTWWGAALANEGLNEYLVLGGTMVINFLSEYLYQFLIVFRGTMDTNAIAKGTATQHQ